MTRGNVVAIGGLGGSGTRVAALILRYLGLYIGSDLNEALDNLWYTLLFKRRSVLLDSRADVRELFELFRRRMSKPHALSDPQRAQLERLAGDGRLQHGAEWLQARAASFGTCDMDAEERRQWGWKEPNTHLLIDRFLEDYEDVLYIHFERDPFYMAYSTNKLQLENWGPIVFNRDIELSPRMALNYWCLVHRRIRDIRADHPDRVIIVDYDAFCERPRAETKIIADFLGAHLSDEAVAGVEASVDVGKSRKPARRPEDFDPAALQYLDAHGFT